MKIVLDDLISPFQSAFIPKRNITENIVLAQEVLHKFRKKSGFGGLMAAKLDMAKAYDRVEWNFLGKVLKCYGFDDRFSNLILQCVTTPSFSILLNGSPVGFFKSQRGLRQGDPISPYLFILCGEVLSRLLLELEEKKKIHGVCLAKESPSVSHLMFADDLMIFTKASEKEIREIQGALSTYSKWSGQEVNWEKSGVMFSKNLLTSKAVSLRSMAGLKAIKKDALYLGLPLVVGRSKKMTFGPFLDRMSNKVLGWKSKVLSYAGRATLIKAVISAIPSHAMMHHMLPSSLCANMDAKMRRFWWKHDEKNPRSLCMVAWDKICKPKKFGGLGFRRMKDINRALIAKLGWQIAAGEDKLWVKILSKKYCSRYSFFNVRKNKSDSQVWKDIVDSREIIAKGACFKVGDGCSINIWTEPWVPWIDGFRVQPKSEVEDLPSLVEELINPLSRSWKLDELQRIFDPEVVESIMKIHIPKNPSEDKLIWLPNPNGNFSVKSAYLCDQDDRFIPNANIPEENWKKVWKAPLHARWKTLIWRILVGAIPTRDHLAI